MNNKKVTTTDIARAAGVSQTTVSVVLSGNSSIAISDATRKRVIETAKEMGYERRPRNRRSTGKRLPGSHIGRSRLIGLMVPSLGDLYYANIVKYVENYASMMGYEVVICDVKRKREREAFRLQSLLAMGVDGVIVAYTPSDIASLRIISRSVPVVILGESPTNCGIHTIGINSYRCGEMMASFLYELGHRDIALLTAPLNASTLTRCRRIEGARAFLETKGVADHFFVVEDETDPDNDEMSWIEMGWRLTRKLLEGGRKFTAVIAGEALVPGVYRALADRHLFVPQDVSVVGINNTFIGQIASPKLTTIDYHIAENCKLVLEHIDRYLRSDPHTTQPALNEKLPSLIMRESTGCIRA